MPSIKFRFTTECQLTVDGDSYEEAYLKFKDFIHGETLISSEQGLEICPPEDPTVFFEVDDQTDYNTIGNFKGDFVKDIIANCSQDIQARIDHHTIGELETEST